MQFTLHYRGPLKANRGAADKHLLRRHFHGQLKRLWAQTPLVDYTGFLAMPGTRPKHEDLSIIREVREFKFAPLVSERIHFVAELDILMMRPEAPGSIVAQGGDIDNRIKTLLDALKVPGEPNALPVGSSPEEGEEPFFCLLEDDNLITRLSVDTERLLEDTSSPAEVVLLIKVQTRKLREIIATMGLS